MRFYQRAGLILGYEGIRGLCRHIMPRLFARKLPPASLNPQERLDYERLVKDFNEKAVKLGYEDPTNYYWYHTIDLGNGLVTPGEYDYRSKIAQFKFPADMKGMNVLDIGSATGFFAFEFEKRGANVVSVELPSVADWDMPTGETRDTTLKALMDHFRVSSIEALTHRELHGPFEFCRKALNSNVKRCYSTIYDLTQEKLGVDGFDLVFIGDVLIHIFSPLKALATVAPLCRGTLILAQDIANVYEDRVPVMQLYMGGDDLHGRGSVRSWWTPNKLCVDQMLKRVGFKTVSVAGHHTGTARSEGFSWSRTVIHATK